MKIRLLPLIGPMVILSLWLLFSQTGLVNPLYLPKISDVTAKFKLFFAEHILLDIAFTLIRTLTSLVLSFFIAVPIGLFLGLHWKVYKASEVIIDFFRSIPSTSFFPLFFLLFGIGDVAKIAMATFVIFWIMLLNTYYGVKNSPKTRVDVVHVFKATNSQIFRYVVFPNAIPQIVVGIRLSLSLALVIIIVSEMFIGTQFGLGRKIYDSYVSYDTAALFANLLIVGSTGYLLNKGTSIWEKQIIHWVGK